MSRLNAIERQWIIVRTLSSRRFGATVRELAEEIEVSQKTIRRDLSLLRDLGFPIEPRAGAHGRNHWVADSNNCAFPLSFDISEVLALYMGRTLLEPLAGTVIWDSSHSAFRKIRASLTESALEYLQQLGGLIHRTSFRDSCYRQQPQLIDDLVVAVEDQRITFLTYQSAKSTEPLSYDVYPYGLVHHRGSMYLIAHSRQHDEVRTFKVDRIFDVSLETLKFQKPSDFNLRDYLKNSLGVFHCNDQPRRVLVRFQRSVVQYVQEHYWHESQKVMKQKDGTLLVEFRLSDFTELKSWLLSFGENAIVEEPRELRQELLQSATAILDLYSQRELNS